MMKFFKLFNIIAIFSILLVTGCGSEFGEMIDYKNATTRTTAKDITSFVFLQSENNNLSKDIQAVISGDNITATVPFNTDKSSLSPTIEHNGASIYPDNNVVQDFSGSAPVTYTVTAYDGTTKDYYVTIEDEPLDSKEITAYSINGKNGTIGTAASDGSIPISVVLPTGTDVTSLVADFSYTGNSIDINGTPQVSGLTSNDFSSPLTYTVTAADGSTQDYVVTVSVELRTEKQITSFAFTAAANTALSSDAAINITGTTITADVPFGTDISALAPTISISTGATVSPPSGSPQAFSDGVAKTYTVTAEDGSTQNYSVIVNVGLNPAKDITSFKFETATNAALSTDADGIITGTNITLEVPYGTDMSNLKPTIIHTGASVNPASGVGVAFTDGVAMTFTVTAADTSTQNYSVTVNEALNPAKDITSFKFEAATNAALSVDVNSTITGTNIDLTVPFGTTVTALVATFAHTGQSVKVSSTSQVSGTTPNDFTSSVTYTVTAADSSTQDYTVTVSEAANNANDITSFVFRAVDNAELATDVTANIAGTAITAEVPAGTDITALVPTIAISGSSVSPNTGVAQNFSSTVNYTVTADDTTIQIYSVDVSVAANTEKDILTFKFEKANNSSYINNDFTATIDGTAISVELPAGTTVTDLVPTITLSTGASVNPNTGVSHDFSSSATYTVTAEDTSTQDYTVTVTLSDTPIVWDDPVDLDDNISPNGQNVEKVKTAIDEDGNIIIVWQQSDGNYTQLYKAEYRNGSWTIPASLNDCISQGTTSIQDIHVAMVKDNSSNNDAVIAWNRSDGANIRLYKMEYRSGSWGSASIISDSGSDAKKPQLGISKDGTAMLVWKQNGYVTYSQYNGSTWSSPDTIGAYGTLDDDDLNISMNDNGRVIAAWFESSKPRASIYNSGWSSVTDLFPTGSDLSFPRVAINNNNNAIAVYNSWYLSKKWIYKSEHNGSSWTTPGYLGDYFQGNGNGDATVPFIGYDVNNDAVLTWRQSDGSNQQVYMADKRSGTWNSMTRISPTTKDVLSSKIAMSSNGYSAIAWLEPDSSNNYQLFISEYSGGSWYHPSGLADNISPDGANVKNDTTNLYLNEYYFDIAVSYNSSTSTGYKVIVWIQNDGNNDQLFVSRSQN